jgi:DNA-binding response OmpR family regulator
MSSPRNQQLGELPQRVEHARFSIPAEKPRILIVEDEAPVAMVIRFLLGRAGCETEIATTIPKAMQLAQEKDFSLITLDVGMPGRDGFRVCQELKQNPRLKKTPIIFISGRSSLEDQQYGLKMGAADYITKPFDSSEFAPRILSHIIRHEEIS